MKRITYLIISLAILSTSTGKVFAQINPDRSFNFSIVDDYMLRKKVAENPDVLKKYLIYESNMKELINNMSNSDKSKGVATDTLINGRMIIPVVFHIVHNYGQENISDAQVRDAVELLNIDFNKLNSDTTATYSWPAFASRRANLHIEFRLAKIDTNGNYTDGIQRHFDQRANFAYYDLNSDYSWNYLNYLNIYSVGFIYPAGINLPDGAAIGGMSLFPQSNPLTTMFSTDPRSDGVLIRHDGIGSIGTATNLMGQGINALNRTFTHELGHYFNLYHPFQNLVLWGGILPVMGTDGCSTSGLALGFIPVALNNDEVDDTPPIAAASQNTSLLCFVPGSRNTCTNNVTGYGNEVDMPENYMDYEFGYCTNIFTTGQKQRIDATMQNDRRNLWSTENLTATGVLDTSFHPMSIPKADFSPNMTDLTNSNTEKIMICAGSSINFLDYSYNGTPTTWDWSFPGGTPNMSGDINPVITYSTPGIYAVTLNVSNSSGSNSLTKSNYIYVSDPAISITGNTLQPFENVTLNFNNGWQIFNQDGLNTWEITDSASYAGSKCLRIKNFSNNTAGSIDELITPAFDFTTVTPNYPIKVKFKLSYAAQKVPTNALAQALYGTNTADTLYDRLLVHYSVDCGATWVQRYNKGGYALVTAGLDSTGFMPTSVSQWRDEQVIILGTALTSHNVRLKFTCRSYAANNLYIDNVMVGDATTGLTDQDIADNLDFTFYPNPLTDNSVLSFNVLKQDRVSVEIYDVLGKKISTVVNDRLNAGNYTYNLSRETFYSSGVYFVKVMLGNQLITKKITVE
ncbi:MAG: T9SS type A sorting domain-containing protein [Bacteroidia bacterium]|nr:T9SS type A sorting domain-containing protein [Bacteroidia bacterium]